MSARDMLDAAAGTVSVLTAGDVMLDRYWFGEVKRISPEAPVPVLRVFDVANRAGGAANVALNVTALGAGSLLLGAVGDDESGGILRDTVHRHGIKHALPAILDSTTVKLRLVARNQQLLRADFESAPGGLASATTAHSRWREKFSAMCADADAVIFSDYGKGALARRGELGAMLGEAKAAGKLTLVDPSGGDFSRYQGADLLTPNLGELEQAAGACDDDEAIAKAAAGLIERHGFGGVLVTLSERGMMMVRPGGAVLHSPARAREVFDVSGAGDTVAAVAATLTAAGADDRAVLEAANAAAAIVVGKVGTAVATADEVKAALPPGR